MTLTEFNLLPEGRITEHLFKCCGSKAWAEQLAYEAPYESLKELKHKSDNIWFSCDPESWFEAFSHHPRIGDLNVADKKFASTKHLASAEQAGVRSASSDLLEQLRNCNACYEEKFGFIFIVCATGKSAGEMLSLLQERLKNDRSDELKIAVNEQNKITHLRLDKLFE